MKSKKWYILCIGMVFLTTGCVREKIDLTIHKNKSMNFNMDIGISKTFLESYNKENAEDLDFFSDEEIEEMNKEGINATKYDDGKYTGVKASAYFRNIDTLSTTKDITGDLASILSDSQLSDDQEVYLFTVKKGLLKNTYTAKLDFSLADEAIKSSDSLLQDKDVTSKNKNTTDYSSMIVSEMDLGFTVNLPYKAKKNNATTVENGGKKLSWDLLQFKDPIVFTFELYNMTTIYLLGGGFIVTFIMIVLSIILILRNQGKRNKNLSKGETNINRGEKQQYSSIAGSAPATSNLQNQTNQSTRIQSIPVTTKPILQPNPISPQPQPIQPTKVVGQSTESGFVMVEKENNINNQPTSTSNMTNGQPMSTPSMTNGQPMSTPNMTNAQPMPAPNMTNPQSIDYQMKYNPGSKVQNVTSTGSIPSMAVQSPASSIGNQSVPNQSSMKNENQMNRVPTNNQTLYRQDFSQQPSNAGLTNSQDLQGQSLQTNTKPMDIFGQENSNN